MSPKLTQVIALLNIARELVDKPALNPEQMAEVVRKLETKKEK
jgi:leucyl aminopeptidase